MIYDNFKIKIKDEEFKKIAGKKLERVFKSERNRSAYEEAKKQLMDTIKPIIAWNRFKVRGFNKDKVILEDGTPIGGGPVVEVTKGAEELIIAICTIGRDVQCEIKKCMRQQKMFQGVFLDALASWAIDSVRKQFVDWLKKEMHSKYGFRTSTLLSPGESDWSIKEQKIIFDLMKNDAEEINVTLSESMMMTPLKSLTFMIGVGKNPLGREEAKNCDFCSMRNKCRYRELREEAEEA